MNHLTKLLSVLALTLVTLLYGFYQRERFHPYLSNPELILRYLPEFFAKDVESQEVISRQSLLSQANRGLMIHLWATWCGVCKDGMPSFLEFAEQMKSSQIDFLLLAVDDDLNTIRRYISQFDLPENVTIALEQSPETMARFGSARVPETYVFAANGEHLNKYVGPQDWRDGTYLDRINRLVDNALLGRGREIEAHQ